jgi:hypothetical protein
MKREHEIRIKTILQQQLYKGSITKKFYKKEIKYIKKIKKENDKRRNKRIDN